MINATKCKANMVTVSSVCPQGDNDLCADLSCTYADTTKFLKLSDGTLNETYYRDDHIHLTLKGQNKLATKLELMSVGNETLNSVATFRTSKLTISR